MLTETFRITKQPIDVFVGSIQVYVLGLMCYMQVAVISPFTMVIT